MSLHERQNTQVNLAIGLIFLVLALALGAVLLAAEELQVVTVGLTAVGVVVWLRYVIKNVERLRHLPKDK